MFKKSPFPKSSYNFGMRMLSKSVITPALKTGAALVKDIAEDDTYSRIQETERWSKIEQGFSQSKDISSKLIEILKQFPPEKVMTVIDKISVANNKYHSKSSFVNSDFYRFADEFLSTQAISCKKAETVQAYMIAKDTLVLFKQNKSNEEIISFILSSFAK